MGRKPNSWANVNRRRVLDPVTSCRVWSGPRNADGYGVVTWYGQQIRVHVLVWWHYNGDVPDGWLVLHRPSICHNRACSEITHLYLGTSAENQADREIDDTVLRCAHNPSAKLTMEQARQIRRLHAEQPNLAWYLIGRQFGVRYGTVSSILHNRTYLEDS